MTTTQQRQRSPDGHWEWDGTAWQPLLPVPAEPQADMGAMINGLVFRGYRVVSQTETTAQLVRPKKFSFVWASFWFIFGLGVGIFFYLFYYMSKRDEILYLTPTGASDSMGPIPMARLEGRR